MAAGDRLAGRYRLDARIAAGGTSAIWRAHDERIDRAVAVKVPVSPDAKFDPERLRAEARITASIDHPAVVEVYDYGQAVTPSGRVVPFAVMPLLAGVPLGARLVDGPLQWRVALTVASRVADVLAAAHRAGVVHQDVSAENVLLTDRGAILLDFGLAVEVGSRDPVGRYAGTPPYVAPERAAGSPAHPSSDVYALGVLLFEMLMGRRPYPETTWDELTAVTRHGPGPNPDGASAVIADLCSRMLAAEPADRPGMAECKQVLNAALAHRRYGRLAAVAVAAVAVVALAAVLDGTSDPGADDVTAGDDGVAVVEPRHRDAGTGDPGSTTDDREAGKPAETSGPDVEAAPSDPAFAALEAFVASLDDSLTSGDIRPDVHLDLEQVATNLYWDQRFADDGVAQLRRKLDDRFGEGAVTQAVWEQLHNDVDAIAAAAG